MWKFLILITLVGTLLAACQTGFRDISQELPVQKISQTNMGKYTGIAWPSEEIIAVVIDESNLMEQDSPTSYRPKIGVLDTASNKLTLVQIDPKCKSYSVRSFQVLPNQQVGYIFKCPELGFRTHIIQAMDLTSVTSTDLYTESIIGRINEFSYSGDMKDLILVDVEGPYTKSSLLHFDSRGKKTNITPDFLRADFPAWSSRINLIAFLGTKRYPNNQQEYKSWREIENLLHYPWQIYLYNPESLTTEELPLDVVDPLKLEWSPDGTMLAFSGEYKGVPGVWIVSNLNDRSNLTIIRVVNGLATFDFSPDSKSIAFAYIGLQNTEKQNTLYVVDIDAQNVSP